MCLCMLSKGPCSWMLEIADCVNVPSFILPPVFLKLLSFTQSWKKKVKKNPAACVHAAYWQTLFHYGKENECKAQRVACRHWIRLNPADIFSHRKHVLYKLNLSDSLCGTVLVLPLISSHSVLNVLSSAQSHLVLFSRLSPMLWSQLSLSNLLCSILLYNSSNDYDHTKYVQLHLQCHCLCPLADLYCCCCIVCTLCSILPPCFCAILCTSNMLHLFPLLNEIF